MTIAENVANAYRARQSSGNWAKWSMENKEMAELLSKAAHDEYRNHSKSDC